MTEIISKESLNFSKFEDISAYTKTFTSLTNITVNLRELYEFLPITPYIVIPKKRGRKKKGEVPVDVNNLKEGSIITLKYKDEFRGVILKPKKKTTKKKWFGNSFTVVMFLDKRITFKICQNGTFQMTGCKSDEHAMLCIKYIWNYMKDSNTFTYNFDNPEDTNLFSLVIPSLRNISFYLGFKVDREKLKNYMSHNTKYRSILETSFGSTGVNIKFVLNEDISKMPIKKLCSDGEDWVYEDETYQTYLDIISPKERDKKLGMTRRTTFLVFHSGKVIMSGLIYEFMEEVYNLFIQIITEAFDDIQEKLTPWDQFCEDSEDMDFSDIL